MQQGSTNKKCLLTQFPKLCISYCRLNMVYKTTVQKIHFPDWQFYWPQAIVQWKYVEFWCKKKAKQNLLGVFVVHYLIKSWFTYRYLILEHLINHNGCLLGGNKIIFPPPAYYNTFITYSNIHQDKNQRVYGFSAPQYGTRWWLIWSYRVH